MTCSSVFIDLKHGIVLYHAYIILQAI